MITIKDLFEWQEKGQIISTSIGKAKVLPGIKRLGKMDAIYLDVVDAEGSNGIAVAVKIENKIACIVRNKAKMLEIGLTTNERTAIYCHELGHCFSENQHSTTTNERNLEDEIDSDTFAVEECEVEPEILSSAIMKTMQYSLNNATSDISKERIDNFKVEFDLRLKNAKMLMEKSKKIQRER